jgi:hypothetical protein
MSRTKRFKKWKDDEPVRDNKSRRSHKWTSNKMKPYATQRGKFVITTSTGNENSYHIVDKVTETAKLVRNNANRSLKKGIRQQAKKDINDEIDGTEYCSHYSPDDDGKGNCDRCHKPIKQWN